MNSQNWKSFDTDSDVIGLNEVEITPGGGDTQQASQPQQGGKESPSTEDIIVNGIGGGIATSLGTVEYIDKLIPKETLRKLTYEIAKESKGGLIGLKSGQLYQGFKRIARASTKLGTRLGAAGQIASTLQYVGDFDKATTGKHTNFAVSTVIYGLSINPVTAPVFAPIGFVYGAAQFGSFVMTGKSLEENIID
ncbi:hypothetical protein [Pontibacter sp. 172403-2]|uniref:hypothetical protein n=1 Tax=Pontibacter rufus TaxID=2791028 RepID=UPI001E28D0E9|nr:hypothetical protein [Pontibacter sp. 172403-2]